MENFLMGFGLVGLFAVSFLAATLVPLGSEAAVAAMGAAGTSLPAVLMVATAGNCLGALVNYAVGRWGGRVLLSRLVDTDPEKIHRVRGIYGRWGAPVLFFAWLPVIGDPLTLLAGVLHVNLAAFAFWVTLGKGLRYWLVLQGVGLLG